MGEPVGPWYFITVGDPHDNTLSHWLAVEPCHRAEVRGVVVTMPDDLGIGLAEGAEVPSGPMTGAIDSATLLDAPH